MLLDSKKVAEILGIEHNSLVKNTNRTKIKAKKFYTIKPNKLGYVYTMSEKMDFIEMIKRCFQVNNDETRNFINEWEKWGFAAEVTVKNAVVTQIKLVSKEHHNQPQIKKTKANP